MLPYLIHAGRFTLPTFGALAALGLMLALFLSQWTAVRAGVDPERLWDAGVFAVVTAFVLSRVLLVVAHAGSFAAFPALLLTVPSLTAPGLLLSVAATAAWMRWKGVDLLRALDAWAPCATLVWAFLALGHLAEGSDPGMESRWGVRLPGETLKTHPVALYACVVALVLTGLAMRGLAMRVAKRRARPGEVAGWTLVAAGVSQFFLSFLRLPGMDGGGGLDVLQWVSLGMVAAGAAILATTVSIAAGR